MNSTLTLIAVQLYTVRDQVFQHGMKYVLDEVSSIGYNGIEIDGYGDLTFAEFKTAIDALQLKVVGRHINLERLETEFDQIVSEQQALGNSILVSSSIPVEFRTSEEGYRIFANTLAFWGKKLYESGIKLCYHNHAFELEAMFAGQSGLEILLDSVEPEYIHAEFDTYWIQRAGLDPAAYIRRYAGRTPVLHIKDMTNDTEQTYAEIGAGTLDWASIFDAAQSNGVEAYIVEQDECCVNSLLCIRRSWENLVSMTHF